MRAGTLDRIITIQDRTRARDPASGEMLDTWTSAGTVRAQKLEGKALERWASDQKVAEASIGFKCRWNPALVRLTPDRHRILYGQMECEILGVQEVGRREGVVVLCVGRTEGLNALGQSPED